MVVNGASFDLEVDPPVTGIPAISTISLSVSSGDSVTIEGNDVTIKDDMESQTPITINYTNANYTMPGTLKWDGKLNDSQESSKVTKDDNPVIIDDTNSGTIKWEVVAPAQDVSPVPAGGSPIPDSAASYNGKWTLTDPGQGKVTVSE
ncbi:MAG: hypothetical protein ACXAC7_24490 [Candidatus Hodarchaeales archaeon]